MSYRPVKAGFKLFFNQLNYPLPLKVRIGLDRDDFDITMSPKGIFPAGANEFSIDDTGNFVDTNGVEEGKMMLWCNENGSAGSQYVVQIVDSKTFSFKFVLEYGDGSEIDLASLIVESLPPGMPIDTFNNRVDLRVRSLAPRKVEHFLEDFGDFAGGATNASSALQEALNALKQDHGGTLVIPDFTTKIAGDSVVNMLGHQGAVRIVGAGGSSVLHVAQGTGRALLVQNTSSLMIEDLTVRGSLVAPGDPLFWDCSHGVFGTSYVEQVRVRSCQFLAIGVNAPYDSNPGNDVFPANKNDGIISVNNGELIVEDSQFGGCAPSQCGAINATDWDGVTIRDCQILDYSFFDGATVSKTGDIGTWWIRVINQKALTDSRKTGKIKIQNVRLDENITSQILINGATWVEIDNAAVNNNVFGYGIVVKNSKHTKIKDTFVGYDSVDLSTDSHGIFVGGAGEVEFERVELGQKVKYIGLGEGLTKAVFKNCTLPGGDEAANGIINPSNIPVEINNDLIDSKEPITSVNLQTGTSYVLATTDDNAVVAFNNAAGCSISAPNTLRVGFECDILQLGTAQGQVVGAGATVYNKDSKFGTNGQYSIIHLKKIASGTFVLTGDVANAVVAAPKLLDLLGVSAAAAYGLRKLKNSYVGSCVRVRRSTDNAETDIGFATDGKLDWAQASAFGASLFITKWYDQSGSGNYLKQTTVASQPALNQSDKSVNFDGSNDFLLGNANLDLTSTLNVTVFNRAKFNALSGSPCLFEHSPQAFIYHGIVLYYDDGAAKLLAGQQDGPQTSTEEATINTSFRTLSVEYTRSSTVSDAVNLFVDGSASGNTNLYPGSAWGDGHISEILYVGARAGNSLFLNGKMQELVILPSVLSGSNRSAGEGNITDFYA